MAQNTCPVCNTRLSDVEVASITVNNSQSQYFDRETSRGICEKDVVFEVSFPGNDDVSSYTVCNPCYKDNKHLTDEYIENYL